MRLHLMRTAALSAVLLVASGRAGAQQAASNNPESGQTQQQITEGRTVENHARLADYFKDLASQEQALAESYARIATMYKEKTPPAGLDAAAASELRKQYKRLADTETKAAAAATNLAAYHVRLAELTAHEPVPPKRPRPDESAFRR